MKSISKYTLCISDLMMGLLFIFMLLSMKFMLEHKERKARLLDPLNARTKLILGIEKEMKKEKMKVEVDLENGVLSLRDISYFDKGSYELSFEGKLQFEKVKNILGRKVICYSDLEKLKEKYPNIERDDNWGKYYHGCDKNVSIDSILIEGHADQTPTGPGLRLKGVKDNIDLAVKRSKTVFELLTGYKESVKGKGNYLHFLSNKKGQPLFGMVTYGNLRGKHSVNFVSPLPQSPPPYGTHGTDGGDDRNPSSEGWKDRRIDIRFIMAQSEEIQLELKKSIKVESIEAYEK